MNSKGLKNDINKKAAGTVLNATELDPSYGGICLEVDSKKVRDAIEFLIEDSSWLIDWCENILTFEDNGKISAVYIFESRKLQKRVVLKIPAESKKIKLPSLRNFWPSVEILEDQLSKSHEISFEFDQSWSKNGTWI